ncbi:TIGR04219 family outer membrane beta-barrel protein [Oceanospirillum linum]|uniref:Outer membrane protein n=1 Tax=Oceanospirillum linum TaxID=966 RepID=A0A1T1HF02_OCELI|nr:TIGR04219 family outer membrane beta-barrel protein [Oceanospirillum linum]OOV88448.1 hypothetical protein BTA35_0202765 [Oceanospirillum linum]SEF56714.1 outer membrane protein [Oleiphilus messinensis]SMP05577.1 outer membrane protein [Oceanospirillum linum]
MFRKLAPLSLALVAINAQADFIGLQAGAGMWQPDLSGSFQSEDSSATGVDMERDLGFTDTTANNFYVAVEHPVPFLPNFRLERTSLSESRMNTLSQSISFEGQTYTASAEVDSKLDLSHTDYTGYYEILDGLGWLSADIGLTVRQFDGEISIKERSGSANESVTLDVPVPLLYGKGQFDIPMAPFPLAVGGMINYLSVGGATISDHRLYVAAAAPWVVEVGGELGYRRFNMELDDVDGLDADLTASGWYASATVHF